MDVRCSTFNQFTVPTSLSFTRGVSISGVSCIFLFPRYIGIYALLQPRKRDLRCVATGLSGSGYPGSIELNLLRPKSCVAGPYIETAFISTVSNVSQVTAAAHKVLKKMDIQYHSTSLGDNETEIKASTDELDITISLTPITASATKVDVNAVKNRVFKDKATAAEILYQIELELESASAPGNAFPKVFIKNDCHRAIDIVVYYLDGNNGPASWQTRGWFSIEPGQKKHVVDTHNRYIYFYGEMRSGNKRIWTGNYPQWFEGKRYDFFRVDMGMTLVDFTQAFSCD